MRIPSAIVTGLALALVLSACGSDDDSGSDTPHRPPPKVAALGPFVGECGNVTADEVRDIAGLGAVAQSFENSTGCNFQAGGMYSPSVTFASYRGSPIDREKAWVSSVGRAPDTIEVGGHTGFQALDPGGSVCDLAVQLGDDFFEWSISEGLYPGPGNPCDKAEKLAELTIERLG